jgi:hypothetical protein
VNRVKKRVLGIITLVISGALVLTAGSCTAETAEEVARNEAQAQKSQGETLEKKNLELKRQREEDPNAIRYLYLYSFGEPMGYYITKGKISSSGSQRTPEQDNMWTCRNNHGCQPIVVDGAKDDGSYGAGDPGVFFFLADGTMIETSFDYLIADKPITAVNIPLLGGSA